MYSFLSWVVAGWLILLGFCFLCSLGIALGSILIVTYELGRWIVKTIGKHL